MEIKEQKYKQKISILLEDLNSLEAYISDLFTFSPLPICFISPVGVMLEFNPAFEEISGYKFYEVVGDSARKLFRKGEMEELIKETMEKGESGGREISLSAKDKKKIPVSAFARARKDEEGRVIGLFLGVFNLTEIKRTERELEEKIEELERFQKIAVGRELKMIELKKNLFQAQAEIKKLKEN